jgi:general secretion pathway protein G
MVRTNKAFTLMEIILVVVIIGILAALVAPRLIGRGRQARIAAAQVQLESLRSGIRDFDMKVGRLPTPSEGLQALVERPAGLPESVNWRRCLDSRTVPTDPWGNDYVYRRPREGEYELFSKGPDGQADTEDDIGEKID